MQMQKSYTIPQVAEILGIPYQTLRSWGTREFLSFTRLAEDADETESARPVPGVPKLVKGRWSRFDEDEICFIAIMAEAANSGVPLSVAAHVADTSARLVLHNPEHRELCIARVGDLRYISAVKRTELGFSDNWFVGDRWRPGWLDPNGTEVVPDVPPHVPTSLLLIDVDAIRGRVRRSISEFDARLAGSEREADS